MNIEFDMSEFPLAKGMDNEIYHQKIKIKGVKEPVDIFSAPGGPRNILKALSKDTWSSSEHRDLAIKHFTASMCFQEIYSAKLDEAMMALCGRKFEVSDYKISGIGRDEFSEEQKTELRFLVRAIQNHKDIAYAHAGATRFSIHKMKSEAEELFLQNRSAHKPS